MSPTPPISLSLCQLNCENLFIHFEMAQNLDPNRLNEKEWQSLSTSQIANKPIKKVKWLARTLLDMDADIILLNEVGGRESLDLFNQHFLKDLYQPYLVEGNSDRGIDIGYLVRRTLPFRTLLISHRNRPLNALPGEIIDMSSGPHFFSRDALELRLFTSPKSSPSMIFLLVHLKSKREVSRFDPEGRLRRTAECRTLCDIYNNVRQECPDTPVIVAGDFNGTLFGANSDPEFEILTQTTDLIDPMALLSLNPDDLATQIQFSRYHGRQLLRLDYILISPQLQSHLESKGSGVYLYRDENGSPIPYAKSLTQRQALPSDHYPVILKLKGLIF